ncbi:CYTH domain-containing protein [Candidatus Woesearchaeota archaeon]|nr:CYTH domain-containing protein [Candidatus Woesearchaeota archaeon]
MKEIEIKIIEVDVAEVKKQLEAGGAKIIGEYEQEQTIFRKKDFKGVFRIRKSTDANGTITFYTTLKTRIERENVKAADEREQEVDSWETGEAQAASLGFTEEYFLKKHRIEYQIENVQFCLDTMHTEKEDLPTYLEIEAEEEILVLAWAEKLGFTQEQLRVWSTKDVLKHYNLFT